MTAHQPQTRIITSFGRASGYMGGNDVADTASLRVRIFDGQRRPLADATDLFIRILDGNQDEHVARAFNAANLTFTDLPLFDNDGDNYTVLASKPGHVGAGFFPVKLSPAPLVETVDLMLIPAPCQFDFEQCHFANLRLSRPVFCEIRSTSTPAPRACTAASSSP